MRVYKSFALWLFLAGILIVSSPGFSASAFAMESSYDRNFVVPELQQGFKTEAYEVEAGKKLQRGLQNFFLGWLEVPHGVKGEYYYRKQEYLPGGIEPFFIGAFRGFGNGLKRTAVGFYEVISFAFPQKPILQEFDEWLY